MKQFSGFFIWMLPKFQFNLTVAQSITENQPFKNLARSLVNYNRTTLTKKQQASTNLLNIETYEKHSIYF